MHKAWRRAAVWLAAAALALILLWPLPQPHPAVPPLTNPAPVGIAADASAATPGATSPTPAGAAALPVLADLVGRPLPLSAGSEQALLLAFWASWCEPCRTELPELAVLERASDGRLQVVAVNLGEGPAEIRRFASETGLQLTWATDPHGSAAAAFRVMGLPSAVLIGPEGQMLAKWRGAVQLEMLERVLMGLHRRPMAHY